MSSDPNTDYRIIATAEDAILAKQAATEANYYDDPFCAAFAQAANLRTNGAGGVGMGRKRHFQPIIKRGTHARVCCMDRALTSFLKLHAAEPASKAVQVVVLGAGKDTSYFRWITKSLMGLEDYRHPSTSSSHNGRPPPPLPRVKWFEVDHSGVINEKVKTIQSTPILSQCCSDLQPITDVAGGFEAEETFLRLVPADLREDPLTWFPKLKLKPKLPTLFIVECVLMYMPEHETETLLQGLAQGVNKAWIALYEPILGETSQFGKMMAQNLVQAKVAVSDSCLLRTKTLESQVRKLAKAGFVRSVGVDLWQAYQTIVTAQQRQQANQAEFLDELEEWMLIMRHYCLVVATNNPDPTATDLTCVGPESPMGFMEGQCKVHTGEG